ncbi:MAG: methionine ABC transporter ATP-binding protein [Bdellovibrionales bacterium RIFCSPHIGHO2_01_FULL_40_29]|nr:MAG: methionine ABC transporter ATP-binding protein [Bdellovibrionales bacterium RIFCSPHIGHO2_01_FULL_40_29]OFZ33405.1 MAG: methionine ABC transporter ATP-binding protein [Bdellovibrionales bacterium RIFCSPHIGHO2_02_FULL_40_15]
MEHALAIKDLKFSYGSNKILNIPDFQMSRGENVFLFGSSGSGKSTLLELIAGILKTQSGELNVLGEKLHEKNAVQLDHFRAQNVGYIFQSFNLIPYLSVIENIKLPLMFLKHVDTAQTEKLLNHLVDSLELKKYIHRRVTDLSVGQQQRVAVARALLKRPKLILADEPTSALDYNHREKFLQLLFQVCEEIETSVLFVSHDRTIEKLFHRSVGLDSINTIQHTPEVIL